MVESLTSKEAQKITGVFSGTIINFDYTFQSLQQAQQMQGVINAIHLIVTPLINSTFLEFKRARIESVRKGKEHDATRFGTEIGRQDRLIIVPDKRHSMVIRQTINQSNCLITTDENTNFTVTTHVFHPP